MNKQLTPKQRAAFDFIRNRVRADADPSYREIAKHIGAASVNSAAVLVDALVRKGWIKHEYGARRNFKIAKGK